MSRLTRFCTLFALLAGMTAALAGCDNTIRGIGKDINETTDAVKDSV